jgi:hypothetical protein
MFVAVVAGRLDGPMRSSEGQHRQKWSPRSSVLIYVRQDSISKKIRREETSRQLIDIPIVFSIFGFSAYGLNARHIRKVAAAASR